MPGKMSNYLENGVLTRLLGAGSFSFPIAASLYLGVCTALTESADGNTLTEISISGTGYGRRPVAFTASSGSSTSNTAAVTFNRAAADWGTLNYFIVCDAASAGNVLYWGPINNPMTCLNGEQLEIDPNQLLIYLTGSMTTALADAVINSTLRGAIWSQPTAGYAALLSAYNTDADWTEVNDANYARQAITWAAISDGTSSNSARLQWPAANAQYTATYVAVFSAASGGTMLFRNALSSPKAVGPGKNFRFEIGDLTVKVD